MRERSRLEFPWALFLIVAALLALLVLDWALTPELKRAGRRDSFVPGATSQANPHPGRVEAKNAARNARKREASGLHAVDFVYSSNGNVGMNRKSGTLSQGSSGGAARGQGE